MQHSIRIIAHHSLALSQMMMDTTTGTLTGVTEVDVGAADAMEEMTGIEVEEEGAGMCCVSLKMVTLTVCCVWKTTQAPR